jgi:hypothetical protein
MPAQELVVEQRSRRTQAKNNLNFLFVLAPCIQAEVSDKIAKENVVSNLTRQQF